MKRRFGLRGRTDFRVVTHDGALVSSCRGIEVSPTGIVLDRGRSFGSRPEPVLMKLEIRLPERFRALVAWARPVWARGTHQAFRFVRMNDADRLTLAEHLDLLHLRGAVFT